MSTEDPQDDSKPPSRPTPSRLALVLPHGFPEFLNAPPGRMRP